MPRQANPAVDGGTAVAEATKPVDAIKRPVGRPRKEAHTGDMKLRDLPVIGGSVLVHEGEPIVLAESSDATKDYLKELSFMEDVMTIRLEKTGEKNAPKWHQFSVNGVTEWVQPGMPWKLKRKYVEVIARAVPWDIQTETGSPQDEHPKNNLVRNPRSRFPFSVIHDPSPRGAEWLTKILMGS